MARKIVFVDDMDQGGGTEADAGTISFGFEGQAYEIDLSTKNRAKLAAQLQPWIAAARTTGTARGAATRPRLAKARSGSGRSPDQLAAIRDWAKRNGHVVSARGRIAGDVIAAFDAAQAPTEPNGRAPRVPEAQ